MAARRKASHGSSSIAVGSHHSITVEGSGRDEESTFRSEMCFTQFDPSTSGEKLFQDTCSRSLRDMQHGFNTTIIAVGSAQAGKSAVISGNDKDIGLGARAFRQVATLAEELRQSGKSVLLSFSAAEFVPLSVLRDEEDIDLGGAPTSTKIRDLLNPHGRPMRVIEREVNNQAIIDGLTEVVLKQDRQLEELFLQATRLRRLGVQGDANHHAGSNAIFRVKLAHSEEGQKLRVVSTLDLVDTAGYSAKGKNARYRR